MIIKTRIVNLCDKNELLVFLPCEFEEVKDMFEKAFGFCNVQSDKDFICCGLYSEDKEDYGCYAFDCINDVAKTFLEF